MEQIVSYVALSYPITLIVIIALVALWYSIDLMGKKSPALNVLMLVGTAVYLISFFANYTIEWFMIIWFLRDLMIFVLFVKLWEIFFQFKKILIPVFVLIAAVAAYFYYRDGKLPVVGKSNEVATLDYDDSAEILFDIKNRSQIDMIKNLLSKYDPEILLAFPQATDTAATELDDFYTIDVSDDINIDSLITELEQSGLTDVIEINERITLSPPEEYSTEAIGSFTCNSLNDPDIIKLWGFEYMEIDKLYKTLKKKNQAKQARIFILDTGVDAVHEDIADNYTSLSEKFDEDTDRHGTHCAGIAAAVSNNKIGIASLNLLGNNTTTSSITVLPGGSGTQEGVIDGIIMAANNGADVISMSLGGRSSDSRQKAYEEAIKYANNKGAIVVVAAGNNGSDARNHVPASCKGVITVSAVDNELQKASFSNMVNHIDYKVAAPGVNIYSTIPDNKYEALNGTSMATPYVAGLVGVMKSIQPNLTTPEVAKILMETGIDTKNTSMTGMFIQPLAAINAIQATGTMTGVKRFFTKLVRFETTR